MIILSESTKFYDVTPFPKVNIISSYLVIELDNGTNLELAAAQNNLPLTTY